MMKKEKNRHSVTSRNQRGQIKFCLYLGIKSDYLGDKTPTQTRARFSTTKQEQVDVVRGLIFSTCSAVRHLQMLNLRLGPTNKLPPSTETYVQLCSTTTVHQRTGINTFSWTPCAYEVTWTITRNTEESVLLEGKLINPSTDGCVRLTCKES